MERIFIESVHRNFVVNVRQRPGEKPTRSMPKILFHLSLLPRESAFVFADRPHGRERATRCAPAERAATTFALGRFALLLFKQHT